MRVNFQHVNEEIRERKLKKVIQNPFLKFHTNCSQSLTKSTQEYEDSEKRKETEAEVKTIIRVEIKKKEQEDKEHQRLNYSKLTQLRQTQAFLPLTSFLQQCMHFYIPFLFMSKSCLLQIFMEVDFVFTSKSYS
jgi:hypothetical protein